MGIGRLGSPRQSRQSSAVTRPPTASPCSRVVWLGVLRVFRGRVCAGKGPRFEDILF